MPDEKLKLVDSSKERVAFELMQLVDGRAKDLDNIEKNKKYYLSLYVQCLRATSGNSFDHVLKES